MKHDETSKTWSWKKTGRIRMKVGVAKSGPATDTVPETGSWIV